MLIPVAYGVVFSMFVFHCGDQGSNPDRGSIADLYIKSTLGNNRLSMSPGCT